MGVFGRLGELVKGNSSPSTPTGGSSPTHGRSGSSNSNRKSGTSRGNSPPNQPQSAFAQSAMDAANSGMKYKHLITKKDQRIIDETTDMSTLTDTEIMQLMEGMEGDVLSKPLITGPVPLLAVRGEYLHGNETVLQKLEWLEENKWDQVWRARGDGDCFYRSFTLAYLLRILYAPDPTADAAKALDSINATVPSMESVGFQRDLLDEFIEPLVSTVATFIDPAPGAEPTEYSLLQVLQDPEKSNSIVVALRLMTGAFIRTHPDHFEGFLFSPSTLEPVSAEQFCREEVEPCGKEADHAQIMALSSTLAMPVRVAYLDRSEVNTDDVINWVTFGEEATGGLDAKSDHSRPLTLLYRPGHFDVVTKDQLQLALQRSENDLAAADKGKGTAQSTAAGSGVSAGAVASGSGSGSAGYNVEPTPTTTAQPALPSQPQPTPFLQPKRTGSQPSAVPGPEPKAEHERTLADIVVPEPPIAAPPHEEPALPTQDDVQPTTTTSAAPPVPAPSVPPPVPPVPVRPARRVAEGEAD